MQKTAKASITITVSQDGVQNNNLLSVSFGGIRKILGSWYPSNTAESGWVNPTGISTLWYYRLNCASSGSIVMRLGDKEGLMEPLKPGSTYTLTAYVRGKGSVRMYVAIASASSPVVSLIEDTWQRMSLSFTVPDDYDGTMSLSSNYIDLVRFSVNNASHYVVISRAKLEEGNMTTEYCQSEYEKVVMPDIDPHSKRWVIDGEDTGVQAEGQNGASVVGFNEAYAANNSKTTHPADDKFTTYEAATAKEKWNISNKYLWKRSTPTLSLQGVTATSTYAVSAVYQHAVIPEFGNGEIYFKDEFGDRLADISPIKFDVKRNESNTGMSVIVGTKEVSVGDGKDGTSVTIKDTIASTDNLPTTGAVNGDGYIIGDDLWVYTGGTGSGMVRGFKNVGAIKGPKGDKGDNGDKGDKGLTDAEHQNLLDATTLANTKAQLADTKAQLADTKAQLAATNAQLAETKANAANTAAANATSAASAANSAATAASRVNVTWSGTKMTVTDQNGTTHEFETKGKDAPSAFTVNPNLYGYGNRLETWNAANGKIPVHTATGLAMYCGGWSDSSYINIFADKSGGTFASGTYGVSGRFYFRMLASSSATLSTIRFSMVGTGKGSTFTYKPTSTSVTLSCTSNTWSSSGYVQIYEAEFAVIIKSTGNFNPYVSIPANTPSGVLEVRMLKIENLNNADVADAECTGFTGLANNDDTVYPNLLFDTERPSSTKEWNRNLNGSVTNETVDGHPVFKTPSATGQLQFLGVSNMKLDAGAWYTISYWAKLTGGSLNINMYGSNYYSVALDNTVSINDGECRRVDYNGKTTPSTGGSTPSGVTVWKRHSYTFYTGSRAASAFSLFWQLNGNSDGCVASIAGIKLEKSERATDYCVADSETTEAKVLTFADIIGDQSKGMMKDVADAKSAADTAKSVADQAKTDAASATGAANAATTAAQNAKSAADTAKSVADQAKTDAASATGAANAATTAAQNAKNVADAAATTANNVNSKLTSPAELRALLNDATGLTFEGAGKMKIPATGQIRLDNLGGNSGMFLTPSGVTIIGAKSGEQVYITSTNICGAASNCTGVTQNNPYNVSTSDMRLKTVTRDLDLTIAQLAAAPVFDFTFKDGIDTAEHSGTSAQYWQQLLPNLVHEGSDGFLRLEYAQAAMVAVVSLARRVQELEKEIKRLKQQ